MILLSLAHVLLGRPMQRRFESDPLFKATLLLLQERIPKVAALYSHPAELSAIRGISGGARSAGARLRASRHADAGSAAAVERPLPRHGHQRGRRQQPLEGPRRHPLARGQHVRQLGHVLLHPRRGERRVLVDRAPADAASAPTHYEAIFTEARAEFRRRDNDFETHTEIVVSPEDDIELRRLRITNRSRTRRTIDVTSYAEVVLAPPAADALHPAFSNLFVQTEIVRAAAGDPVHAPAPLARRAAAVDVPSDGRPRAGVARTSPTRPTAWRSSAAAARSPPRRRWLEPGRLSGSQGSVLDPIVAIRHRHHARAAADGDDRHGFGHGRDARRARWASSASTRTGISPTASSTSRGRTAG